jgi:hypothetical protein
MMFFPDVVVAVIVAVIVLTSYRASRRHKRAITRTSPATAYDRLVARYLKSDMTSIEFVLAANKLPCDGGPPPPPPPSVPERSKSDPERGVLVWVLDGKTRTEVGRVAYVRSDSENPTVSFEAQLDRVIAQAQRARGRGRVMVEGGDRRYVLPATPASSRMTKPRIKFGFA